MTASTSQHRRRLPAPVAVIRPVAPPKPSGQPITAVIITTTLGLGGAEQWIRMLVTLSDPAAIEWRIVLLNGASWHRNVIEPIARRPGATIYAVGPGAEEFAPTRYGTATTALTAALDGANIAIAWGGGNYWPLPIQIPTVMVAHGSCFYTQRCISDALAGGATHVVSVSHKAANSFERGRYREVIWNGVDVGRLKVTIDRHKVQKDIWSAESEFWFGENIYVGYLGRLAAEKNAIAAAQAVSQCPWNFKCILIGDGTEATAIVSLARSLCGQRLSHHGPVDDVGNHWHAMDVAVFASHREGNCLALIEAMIVGTPIVTTRVGAVEEFEEAARCKLFYSLPDFPSANEIYVAVREAAAAGRTADRVKAAQAFAIANLTGQKMADNWMRYLTRIVRQNVSFDFNWITDRIALGNMITTPGDVDTLKQSGITHVINNQIEGSDEQLLSGSGLTLLENGTPDDRKPKPAAWFNKSIGFAIDALRHSKSKIYVHCTWGIARSSSTVYAILRVCGHGKAEAEKLIRDARPKVTLDYIRSADAALSGGQHGSQ